MLGDIIQPTHLLFILVVALLVLGPKRLPEVGRSLGRGLRDFRHGLQGVQDEARGMFHDALDEPAQVAPTMVQTTVAPTTVEPAPAKEPVTATMPSLAPSASRTALEPDPADYAD